jgi:plastocyanin
MILTRRRLLEGGSGILAGAALGLIASKHVDAAEFPIIEMVGLPDGSDVWFDPIGLLVQPGQTVRWTNRDAGNSHTVTAYHTAVFGRSRRIPRHAKPWNSDYLMPDNGFSANFSEPGVYDYYCVPHEHAGMVGRIVVGDPNAKDWWQTPLLNTDSNLPKVALEGFPTIAEIVGKGQVRHVP